MTDRIEQLEKELHQAEWTLDYIRWLAEKDGDLDGERGPGTEPEDRKGRTLLEIWILAFGVMEPPESHWCFEDDHARMDRLAAED